MEAIQTVHTAMRPHQCDVMSPKYAERPAETCPNGNHPAKSGHRHVDEPH